MDGEPKTPIKQEASVLPPPPFKSPVRCRVVASPRKTPIKVAPLPRFVDNLKHESFAKLWHELVFHCDPMLTICCYHFLIAVSNLFVRCWGKTVFMLQSLFFLSLFFCVITCFVLFFCIFFSAAPDFLLSVRPKEMFVQNWKIGVWLFERLSSNICWLSLCGNAMQLSRKNSKVNLNFSSFKRFVGSFT